ncbi:hypothetical protein K493DRAFT_302292 [Basidiobolus meristosporus CBS 931.73]|uniref:Uncharacterized protein n=1 Tax=Basidiobolus meristosporus CBS 931.73 TaxID=1314790 RepID=A0A1Y1Y7V9_9FUNG|nr:hypothetical protein K493DRAFT_302292 [Basidiobolus meristosporus CBS 931.73]|eukprot:ORX94049.1 hypothetical protein K493DRAFT_302292 [Basidiobolus meristosporus CBS 931.73]
MDTKASQSSVLNGMDNLYLKLNEPQRPSTVMSIWEFSEPLDREQVMKQHQHLIEQFPKFRQVVQEESRFRKVWVDHKEFELSEHIEWVTLENSGKKEVTEFASKIYSREFDLKKPMWQTHVIEGLETGGCVVIVRAHHTISDGIGFIHCLLSITSAGPELRYSSKSRGDQKPRGDFARVLDVLMGILGFIYMLLWEVVQISQIAVFQRKSLQPTHGKPVKKRVYWSDDISLEEIKFIRRTYNATVNDVLITILNLALRNHLLGKDMLQDRIFLYMVPVSLRKPDDFSPGNEIGIAFFPIDITSSDPVKLIDQVHSRSEKMKRSIEPWAVRWIVAPLSFLNDYLCKFPVQWFMSKCHAILTNVPGPSKSISFSGKPIDRYIAIPPTPGPGSLGLGILSYDNKVVISGVMDDAEGLEGIAEAVTEQVRVEFEKFLELARTNHNSVNE